MSWLKIVSSACALCILSSLCLPQPLSAAEPLKAFVINYCVGLENGTVSVVDLNAPPPPCIPAPLILVDPSPVGIVITPDESKACVVYTGNNSVDIIDTRTETVIKAIPLSDIPNAIAITPDGSKACVGCVNSVAILDLLHLDASPVYIPVAGYTAVAITPDGLLACACNFTSFSVIDLTTVYSATPSFSTISLDCVALVITPDGSKACVCTGSHTLSIIDLTNITNITNIPISDLNASVNSVLAITPDGSKVCLCNQDTTTGIVYIVDLTSATAVPVNVGQKPFSIAITPDGSKACVCNGLNASVSVIDIQTASVIKTIGVGELFYARNGALPPPASTPYISITPDGSRACVCNTNSNSLSIIDLSTLSVVANPLVGLYPLSAAIMTLPAPPLDFTATLYRTGRGEATLEMHWKPSPSSNIASYEILAWDTTVATVPADTTSLSLAITSDQLKHRHIKKGYLHYLHNTYTIRAITTTGAQSEPVHLEVTAQ